MIGPGSLHATGVVYELQDAEQPPVHAPDRMIHALLVKSGPGATGPVQGTPPTVPARRRSAALTGLVKFVLDSREGQRNERLYWAAARAFEHARQGLVDTQAVAGALVEAATRTGLSEPEARRTVSSAYRSGATT